MSSASILLRALSLSQAIIIGFCKYNEPSHLDLRCLTFSLSALHINFPIDSLLKKIIKAMQATNVV